MILRLKKNLKRLERLTKLLVMRRSGQPMIAMVTLLSRVAEEVAADVVVSTTRWIFSAKFSVEGVAEVCLMISLVVGEVVAEIDLGKNVEVICDTILKSPWRRQPRGSRKSLKLKSMRVAGSVLVQDPSRAALARIPVLHAADVV